MQPANPTDWQPGASLEVIQARAQMLQGIRAFFAERGVMEVETPILSTAATSEVHLSSWFATPDNDVPAYALHTSPELAMKRLLAAGSGDIYQICKVFRGYEQGSAHNPEFSLLEWYRVGLDMSTLMREVAELLSQQLASILESTPEFISYQQLFIDMVGCDPLDCSVSELIACYEQHQKAKPPADLERQDLLDLILGEIIQSGMPRDCLVFVENFPAQQASLARLDENDPRVAKRFEVFCNGLELANGFDELTDAKEQQTRMLNENAIRKNKGMPTVKLDSRFLAALQSGLPACSGVALGLDRLLMLKTGKTHISDVLSFDITRV